MFRDAFKVKYSMSGIVQLYLKQMNVNLEMVSQQFSDKMPRSYSIVY